MVELLICYLLQILKLLNITLFVKSQQMVHCLAAGISALLFWKALCLLFENLTVSSLLSWDQSLIYKASYLSLKSRIIKLLCVVQHNGIGAEPLKNTTVKKWDYYILVETKQFIAFKANLIESTILIKCHWRIHINVTYYSLHLFPLQ